MPRYFFHVRSPGGLVKDLSGVVCADADGAHVMAGKGAGFVSGGMAGHSKEFLRHSFEVMDEAGRTLFKLPFSDIDCP